MPRFTHYIQANLELCLHNISKTLYTVRQKYTIKKNFFAKKFPLAMNTLQNLLNANKFVQKHDYNKKPPTLKVTQAL